MVKYLSQWLTLENFFLTIGRPHVKSIAKLFPAALLEPATGWKITQAKLLNIPAGMHDLVVIHDSEHNTEVDWVRFA